MFSNKYDVQPDLVPTWPVRLKVKAGFFRIDAEMVTCEYGGVRKKI